MPRTLALSAVTLLLAQAVAARALAQDDEAAREAGAAAGDPDAAAAPPPLAVNPTRPSPADDYPPPVDGPALRLPEPLTRLYADGAYAVSKDLSALPYIAGKGRNFRVALGGAWRWRRFAFEGQLPFNLTTIDIATILNQPPIPEDQHQTAFSLGDLTLGVIWTERLAGNSEAKSEALIAGFGLRGRLATHTTRFQFHLTDGSLADFSIPYYFHVEPTLILGGAIGDFRYVINQGAIWLLGPNGYIQDQLVTVPSVYFYDAHYAIGYVPWWFLGASVEVATTIQLNHLEGVDFMKLNGIRAVWVAPSLQFHPGAGFRVDLIARLGVTRGEELYGVLEYVGTHSFTLRVTRAF